MNKHFFLTFCCILCVVVFVICMVDKKQHPPIEEYNNDVFTKELYEKITRIEYIAPDETVYTRDDLQSIHDAYSLLASLKLTEHDNSDQGGFYIFRIYVEDQDDYIFLSVGGKFLGVNNDGYVGNIDISDKLRRVFL